MPAVLLMMLALGLAVPVAWQHLKQVLVTQWPDLAELQSLKQALVRLVPDWLVALH